jgi:regulator of protease activity HflC (stomatin/prohibitin superfamily)
MGTLQVFNNFVDAANKLLDFIFLWGGLFLILQYPIRYFAKGMDKYDKQQPNNPDNKKRQELLRDLLSQSVILLLAALAFGLVWIAPELLNFKWPGTFTWIPATWFRWAVICLVVTLFIYIYGHEHGELRWLVSCVSHTAIIFFGLALDGWMGVLFISLPVLVAYYFTLHSLAMVNMPTASPDDPKEKWKRFIVFASYAWGIQFPMVVVDDHAWKKPETRIPGDFTWDYPVPGLIWTKSHHVVAVTGGTRFKRVEGPGLVFTGQLERAEQIFDLRLQLRTNEIDVVTKDGISLRVRVFMAFRLDPEDWSEEVYKQLRSANPLLRGARFPSYKEGSFPYSPQRVRAALGVTSTRLGAQDATLYWDQWALNIVEDQARKVIAQKELDELWRLPEGQDERFKNAMDVIANELKSGAAPILRTSGILLVASRVVNFNFPSEKVEGPVDEISRQQIAIWSSEREGKRSNIKATAEAEAERLKQQARAYAASLMLKALEEGLKTTREIGLNPHVTAMLFSALQEYIDKQDEAISTEEAHFIDETQEPFSLHKDKEKK